MKVITDLEHTWLSENTVLTLGAFDGIHVGHQALIRATVAETQRKGGPAGVVTFYPHPANVLAGAPKVRYITTPGEKAAILERLGVDIMVLIQFTRELANLTPEEFMRLLIDHLHPSSVWVGRNFTFGRGGQGTADRLQTIGRHWGFDVHVLEPVRLLGDVVSSTRIRRLLAEGRLEEVTALLARYYMVSGEVVPGRGRGRSLGFPTANLKVWEERALPSDGVYAAFALLGDQRFPAVANLGVRPTFGEPGHLLEVHLIDVDFDLYGCDLAVEFVRWLRPEQRFETPHALMAQMHRDVAEARRILQDAHQEDVDVAIRDWSLLHMGDGGGT